MHSNPPREHQPEAKQETTNGIIHEPRSSTRRHLPIPITHFLREQEREREHNGRPRQGSYGGGYGGGYERGSYGGRRGRGANNGFAGGRRYHHPRGGRVVYQSQQQQQRPSFAITPPPAISPAFGAHGDVWGILSASSSYIGDVHPNGV
jgi:hypothetical protein